MDEIIEKEQKSNKKIKVDSDIESNPYEYEDAMEYEKSNKKIKVDSDIDPYEYEDAMEYEERLKQLLKRRKEKKTITK
jgi:hypothetical protein